MAWAWARIARCSPGSAPAPGGRDAGQWLDSARFGTQWLLPQAEFHWTRVQRGLNAGAVLPACPAH
jgi:hypothetical protein